MMANEKARAVAIRRTLDVVLEDLLDAVRLEEREEIAADLDALARRMQTESASMLREYAARLRPRGRLP